MVTITKEHADRIIKTFRKAHKLVERIFYDSLERNPKKAMDKRWKLIEDADNFLCDADFEAYRNLLQLTKKK